MIIEIELIQKEKNNCVDLFIRHTNSSGAKACDIPKDLIGQVIQSYYNEFIEDREENEENVL